MKRLAIILFIVLISFASFLIGSSNVLEIVQGIKIIPSSQPTKDNIIIFDENDFGNNPQEPSSSPPKQKAEVKGETVVNTQEIPEYYPSPIITTIPTEMSTLKPNNS